MRLAFRYSLALLALTSYLTMARAADPAAQPNPPGGHGPASVPFNPPSVVDFTTPISTVKAFLMASQNQLDLAKPQDDAAIRNTLLIPDASKADVEALLTSMSATAKFKRACAEVFGSADTIKQFGTTSTDLLASRLKTIDSAEITMEGDTATLKIPADAATHQIPGTVALKKISGNWKIDAASLFGMTDQNQASTATRVGLTKKLTAIADDMTKEVLAHKYTAARQAYDEFWSRSIKVLPSATPASSPAAAPAAAPR